MPLVRTEVRDRVGVLVLDDPERRNALTRPLVEDIVSAVDAFEADDGVGAVVVTGAPPAFCAGADLSDLAARGDALSDDDASEGLRAIYEGFLRVARCELPTVAAVNGAAVGAGLNMALGCDVRLAAEGSRFDARFVALGLHPGGGGTWLMHEVLGPQGAAALGLFGEVVDGRRAAEIGLAWRCVPDDDLVDDAVAFASGVASAPRELVRRVKATMRAWPSVSTHDDAVDAEIGPQIWSVRQPEFRERLARMKERISRSS